MIKGPGPSLTTDVPQYPTEQIIESSVAIIRHSGKCNDNVLCCRCPQSMVYIMSPWGNTDSKNELKFHGSCIKSQEHRVQSAREHLLKLVSEEDLLELLI